MNCIRLCKKNRRSKWISSFSCGEVFSMTLSFCISVLVASQISVSQFANCYSVTITFISVPKFQFKLVVCSKKTSVRSRQSLIASIVKLMNIFGKCILLPSQYHILAESVFVFLYFFDVAVCVLRHGCLGNIHTGSG